MRNGFTFKNRHSSEFGVTVRTQSRPILPSAKRSSVDIPCRDGVYDFSEANEAGRCFFSERIFSLTLSLISDSLEKMQTSLSSLALWLTGRGALIFDDMPLVMWNARVLDEIVYLPEHSGHKASIDVSFTCEPFALCVFDSDGPYLDSEVIRLDANIPIGLGDERDVSVLGNGDIRVWNFSDRPVRPSVSLGSAARDVTLSLGGKYLAFSADGAVTVDFETQTVSGGNGLIDVSGDFFEFPRGENILHIENSVSSPLEMHIVYTPLFTYGMCLDTTDWGDGDA